MTGIDDRVLMRRCLTLALRGYGRVHPNPLVGCVIVNNGAIVGEGYHRGFGASHAEADALAQAGAKARGSTLYVNLEPCAHHGKTPPCAQAIIAAGVREAVIAVKDPNRLVAGRGMALLKKAGIVVRSAVLLDEAERLNERFLTFHRMGRPFVGLKWAQSIDGRVADAVGGSRWITGPHSRAEAHRLRAGYDACLVGAHTVVTDDPKLTVRHVRGRHPVRIVLDGALRVSGKERVFDATVRTILLTNRRNLAGRSAVLRRLTSAGVEVLGLDGRGMIHPAQLLAALAGEGITSVLVEGGPTTIAQFISARCGDKVHVFLGAVVLGGGLSSLELRRPFSVKSPLRLRDSMFRTLDDGGVLLEGYPEFP